MNNTRKSQINNIIKSKQRALEEETLLDGKNSKRAKSLRSDIRELYRRRKSMELE